MEDYTLFDVEKDYYLGDYARCISKTNAMPVSRETVYYSCLSYYHLKKFDILKLEISKSEDQCVKLISLLLEYDEESDQRSAILARLEIESTKTEPKDDLSRMIISTIYSREKQYGNALKVLHQVDTLPTLFAQINIYISINRLDLAERQLKLMQTKNEFATLTTLAFAQVKLASNCPMDAYEAIASELDNRSSGASPLLLNMLTAAALLRGDYEDAKVHCQNSLDKDSSNAEAMINMIFIMSQDYKISREAKDRLFNQLKTIHPNHEYVKDFERIQMDLQV